MKKTTAWALFTITSIIIGFVVEFFIHYPPGSGAMYYPAFATVLFIIGAICAHLWLNLLWRGLSALIEAHRGYSPPAYQPIIEDECCDGDCEKTECVASESKKEVDNLSVPPPVGSMAGEEEVTLEAADSLEQDAGIIVREFMDEDLPKEDFNGFVEATPESPKPEPLPHEDSRHPNYDPAAGRIIYK